MRVEYSAPSECPTQAAFEAELAGHLGTATFARLGELARTLTVAIEPEPSGFRAGVELVDRSGHATERGIVAPTCEQAMRAIALVAALAARSQAEQAQHEREAIAQPNTNADTAPPPPSIVPPPADAKTRSAPPRGEPRRAEHREEASVSFGVSAGAAVSTGVGPGAAPGLFAAFRVALTGATERSLLFSALGFDSFRRSLDVADVRFSVVKGRLELCPLEPRLSDNLFVNPCAGFELGSQWGRSYADGERVETSHTVSEVWVAATLAVRLSLRFDGLELRLGPELGVPLQRNRFALTLPERPVYEVPRATVAGSAAVGLSW